MRYFWLGIVFIAGFVVPAQAAMNARMRHFVINPLYSSLINFFIGTLAGLLVTSITVWFGQPGNWKGSLNAPWWAWCGGLIGATFVTVAVLSVPKIGATNFSVAVIAGQLIGAVLMDQYGLLNLPQHSATPPRLLGAGLLLIGVWLVQRG